MVSDGRYAKDAIRKLLASARAREASAAKMFESARDNLDDARAEMKAAEAMMDEAEGKWPEIEIDDDETSTASLPSKRRRKDSSSSSTGGIAVAAATAGQSTSLQALDKVPTLSSEIDDEASTASSSADISSTGGIAVAAATTGGIFAAATAGQSRHAGTCGISGAVGVSNAAANIDNTSNGETSDTLKALVDGSTAASTARDIYWELGTDLPQASHQVTPTNAATSNGDNNDFFKTVMVKGCKYGVVNGRYIRKDGAYTKWGVWKGDHVTFEMYRHWKGKNSTWNIYMKNHGGSKRWMASDRSLVLEFF
jgi:hypothetical protein